MINLLYNRLTGLLLPIWFLSFHIASAQTCSLSVTSTNVSCHGQSTATANLTVSGGGSSVSSNCLSPQAPGASDQCSSGCSSTITTNANVTVASGQKVCITANNYSGQIQLNGGVAVLCGTNSTAAIIFNGGALVVTGSITPSSISVWTGSGSSLTNYGTVTLSAATTWEVGLSNHGTLIASSGLTFGYSSPGFVNTGTLTVSSGNLTLQNTGSFVNSNTISISSGNLVIDWSKTFTNNCTLSVGGTLTNHGNFTNAGTITAATLTSDGGSFTNNNKITVSGTTTLSGGTISTGAGSEISSTNFASSVAVNGTGASCSSIRTSSNTTFDWGTSFTGQARYCDLNGTIESNAPNVTTNVSLTTCSCNVSAPSCTYSWKNSSNTQIATTQNVTGLAAGTYTVTATCSGCSNSPLTSSVTITEPTALSFTTTKTDISCGGASDGTITVTASGGTGTKQYSKDNGTTYQSSNSFASLAAGTYQIVVKDANNCTATAQTVTIQNATALSVTIAKTDITCNGAGNGTITVTATGGTGTKQYSKDNGTTYQSSNSFTSLAAGTYQVVVKDANNCTSTAQSITISQPSSISVSTTTTDATCNGSSNGAITITATGGTGTLQYSINNGTTYQSSNSFTGLAAGTYTVIVKDASNCLSASSNVVINQPTGPTVSTSKTDVSCYGLSNGSATVTANGSGGSSGSSHCTTTAPQDCSSGCTNTYTSNTGDISIVNSSDKVCLTATNYTGNISVNAGTLVICGSASPASISITNGGKIIVTGTGSLTATGLTVNNPSFFENYGTVTVNGDMTNLNSVINGKTLTITGNFTDNGSATLTNLCTMTVGGNINNYGTITNRGTISASNTTTVNGAATFIMDNGAELVTSALTLNGAIQGPASGACAAVKVSGVSYIGGGATLSGQLSVCDANGIETNYSTGLSGYLNCNCNPSSSTCTFVWKNSSGTTISTTDAISNVAAGTYTVTATCGGCSAAPSTVVIAQPTLLSVSVSGTVSCAPEGSGTANALATGGTTPYTYSWTPGGATTQSVTGLSAGLYTVTVTDHNSCTAEGNYTVVQSPALVIQLVRNGRNVSANVSGGVAPYTYLWNTPSNQTSPDQLNLPYGTYTVTVTGADGCSSTAEITLSPPVIHIDTKLVDVTSLNLTGAVVNTANPYQSGPTGGQSNDGIIVTEPQLPTFGNTTDIVLEILQGAKNVPMHISFTIDENANISNVKADVKNNNVYNQMVSDYYKIDNTDNDIKKIFFYKYKSEEPRLNFTTNLLNGLVLDQVSNTANKFVISGLSGFSVQTLTIYTTGGQLVKVNTLPEWDGTDNSNVSVSRGTYKFELSLTDSNSSNLTYKGQLILKK